MNGDLATDRDRVMFTARRGSVFAICLVLGFFFGPASKATLELLLGRVGADDVGWLVSAVWAAAFLFGGAIAGNAIAGRRGQFPFSIAFFVFPLSAVLVIGQSTAFHDDYNWRRHEHLLDFALFNIAYPLTFGAMAWVSTMMLARRHKTAWSVGAACALNGVGGGIVFSLAISFLPLGGYIEAIALVMSLAIPAYLTARRISIVLAQSA
jgi:hypothetical protein